MFPFNNTTQKKYFEGLLIFQMLSNVINLGCLVLIRFYTSSSKLSKLVKFLFFIFSLKF